jgi:hypothetical protein
LFGAGVFPQADPQEPSSGPVHEYRRARRACSKSAQRALEEDRREYLGVLEERQPQQIQDPEEQLMSTTMFPGVLEEPLEAALQSAKQGACAYAMMLYADADEPEVPRETGGMAQNIAKRSEGETPSVQVSCLHEDGFREEISPYGDCILCCDTCGFNSTAKQDNDSEPSTNVTCIHDDGLREQADASGQLFMCCDVCGFRDIVNSKGDGELSSKEPCGHEEGLREEVDAFGQVSLCCDTCGFREVAKANDSAPLPRAVAQASKNGSNASVELTFTVGYLQELYSMECSQAEEKGSTPNRFGDAEAEKLFLHALCANLYAYAARYELAAAPQGIKNGDIPRESDRPAVKAYCKQIAAQAMTDTLDKLIHS